MTQCHSGGSAEVIVSDYEHNIGPHKRNTPEIAMGGGSKQLSLPEFA